MELLKSHFFKMRKAYIESFIILLFLSGGIPYLFFKTNIACTLLPHFLLHEKFLKYKVSRQKVTRQAAYQPIRSLDILINPGTAPPLISVWY